MTPDLLTAWTEALRSGTYQQGQGKLRDSTNKFCCLGVLANLVAPEEWRQRSTNHSYNFWGLQASFTPYFLTQVGLSGHIADKLARLNDTGWEFSEIANLLEAVGPDGLGLPTLPFSELPR